jgi:AcrR family transcriptional regulator
VRYGTNLAKCSSTWERIMEKPLDRRIQKTRMLLSNALISLIIEKGYDAVTVQDIIDRANVGRSTFYAHFENKEHLLLSGRGEFHKLLFPPDDHSQNTHPGPAIDFAALFNHIAENHQLAKAMMVNRNDQIVTGFFKDVIALKINDYLQQQDRPDTGKIKYQANAAAAAAISLVSDWLELGMPDSPAKMAEIARKLVLKMVEED